MRLASSGVALDLWIDCYESPTGFDDPSEPDWLILKAAVTTDAVKYRRAAISMDTDDVAHLAAWMTAIAFGQIEPSATVHLQPLIHFPEPDLAVRVLELDEADVKTRWYFQDESSTEDFSWELSNLSHARAFEVVTTRHDLERAAYDLLTDLARYPNR